MKLPIFSYSNTQNEYDYQNLIVLGKYNLCFEYEQSVWFYLIKDIINNKYLFLYSEFPSTLYNILQIEERITSGIDYSDLVDEDGWSNEWLEGNQSRIFNSISEAINVIKIDYKRHIQYEIRFFEYEVPRKYTQKDRHLVNKKKICIFSPELKVELDKVFNVKHIEGDKPYSCYIREKENKEKHKWICIDEKENEQKHEKENEQKHEKKSSKIEKNFIKKLQMIYPDIELQYKIDKYYIDAYDNENKICYEFLGDYWHGNPTKYHENDINPTTQKTFGYHLSQCETKFEYLIKDGYTVNFIWEDDFKNKGMEGLKQYKLS